MLRVAVVGCGLIGERRARVAASSPRSQCVAVVDPVPERAAAVTARYGGDVLPHWRAVVDRGDVDAVVVATPNSLLETVAIATLRANKHVLVEKPMGRNLAEAERMRAASVAAGRVLKVGFNHRYHPAIAEARRRLADGAIGELISIRCRYGHGGRAGYEREWRGNREMAGGGELTDQGVHVADLIHWFAGLPLEAYAVLQTAVWPLGDLEDNAFGLFRFSSGVVAQFHTSWTQWKNLFSLEVFGRHGALVIEGLGRSYGTETLTVYQRKAEGGFPDAEVARFVGDDESWRLEWDDFLGAVHGEPMLGTAEDGVAAMRMLDALYRSASLGRPVAL